VENKSVITPHMTHFHLDKKDSAMLKYIDVTSQNKLIFKKKLAIEIVIGHKPEE
jgi:hypothetical protein